MFCGERERCILVIRHPCLIADNVYVRRLYIKGVALVVGCETVNLKVTK